MIACDGWCNGANPVTHIGSKGYAYCEPCAIQRRQGGNERTRRMRAWELKKLESGVPLSSYQPIPKPASA